MNNVEKAAFISLFNRNGYVLDFSNATFDQFTEQSIGIPVQAKYGLSKGASLEQFIYEEDQTLINKLLHDLLEYYDLNYVSKDYDQNNYKLYEKCKSILEKETQAPDLYLTAIKNVDLPYIITLVDTIKTALKNGDNESAITKSRTLLEEAFCYAIEKKGEVPVKNGKSTDLYKQVKKLYKMNNDKNLDERINELLSGLQKIVDAISSMRNDFSDSHGIGRKRINVDSHTARFAVNSALVASEYIIEIANRH